MQHVSFWVSLSWNELETGDGLHAVRMDSYSVTAHLVLQWGHSTVCVLLRLSSSVAIVSLAAGTTCDNTRNNFEFLLSLYECKRKPMCNDSEHPPGEVLWESPLGLLWPTCCKIMRRFSLMLSGYHQTGWGSGMRTSVKQQGHSKPT